MSATAPILYAPLPRPIPAGPCQRPRKASHVAPAAGAALWRPAGGLESPRLTDRGAGVGAGEAVGRHAVQSAGQVGGGVWTEGRIGDG